MLSSESELSSEQFPSMLIWRSWSMVASTAPLLERSTHSMTSYSMVGNMVLKSIMAWLNSSRRMCRLGLLLLSWPEVGPPPPSGPPFLEPPLLLRLNKLVISRSSAALPPPLTVPPFWIFLSVADILQGYHSNIAFLSKEAQFDGWMKSNSLCHPSTYKNVNSFRG